MAAQGVVNTTGRHLVIVTYDVGVKVQTAYRDRREADRAADVAWSHSQAVDVQTGYVANYRGRRVTRVIL